MSTDNKQRLALIGLMAFIMFLIWAGFAIFGNARAQEAHDWVLAPQYRTAEGAHCCGTEHCQPAAYGELTPIPGGWRHVPTMTEIHNDKPGIYASEDRAGRMFRCLMGGKLVCVFEGAGI